VLVVAAVGVVDFAISKSGTKRSADIGPNGTYLSGQLGHGDRKWLIAKGIGG
jgi:hypothetical protein